MDDAKDFLECDRSMDQIGLSAEDKMNIYLTVAAVLHIGNIEFQDDPDSSKGGCKITPGLGERSLEIVAKMLGLDREELEKALISRVMQAHRGGKLGTVIMVPLKVSEAQNARDALAKAIYTKLFDHIVSSINKAIPFGASTSFIGLLDIAGFEYFPVNSFEQFCINYCNEKLQQFFNERILKEEQHIYEKEGKFL
jgi:myosin-6